MDSNKMTDMKCKGCDKQLTEHELAVMTQYRFERCWKDSTIMRISPKSGK